MTVVEEPQSPPTPVGGTAPPAADTGAPPVLAEGIELIGEYEDSGFKEAPSLIRRPDGQILQLPALLYGVAAHADGRRSYDEIAGAVSSEIRRTLDGSQVRFLVEEKLRPMGVLAQADGTSPKFEKPDPFLALKFRAAVISERTSNRLGTAFKPLFLPLVMLAFLAAFVAADIWLFFGHGVAQALRQSIMNPALFLAIFAGVALAAAFHEIGHAAACRYGGGRPGKMGCGLYLAWPAFYTDVTDAYRLGRRARLRTDLGGVYFNVVIVVITMGAYFATGFEPLLLLVVIQHLEIAHQLLPVVRLDGYYIIADLTGVPDLFARIGPILSSAIPGRKPDDRVRVLKPWVRVAVTAWVFIVVPLLVFELLMVLIHLPRMLGTAWTSAGDLVAQTSKAFADGSVVGVVSSVLQLVVLAIPTVGIGLVLAKTGVSVGRWSLARTEGRPLRRAGALGIAGAASVALALAWLPSQNYKPIQPGERGTIGEAASAVRRLPTRSGPLYSEEVARRRAEAAAAASDQQPDRATTTTSAPPATDPSTAGDPRTAPDPASTTTTAAPTTVTTTARGSTSTTAAGGTTATTVAGATTTTTPTTTTPTTTTTAPPEANAPAPAP